MKELRKIFMDYKWLKSMKFYTKFSHNGGFESRHNARLKYPRKRINATWDTWGIILSGPFKKHITQRMAFLEPPPHVTFAKSMENYSITQKKIFSIYGCCSIVIILKKVQMVKNCSFNPFSHSLLPINTHLLTHLRL